MSLLYTSVTSTANHSSIITVRLALMLWFQYCSPYHFGALQILLTYFNECSILLTATHSQNFAILIMVALCNRADHYIFILFLSFFFLLLLFFPRLISAVGDWMFTIRGSLQIQDAKNRHFGTIAQLCRAISSQLRHVSTIGKKLVKQQYLLYMSW